MKNGKIKTWTEFFSIVSIRDEYKEVIKDFLRKIFNNCELIEDYEAKNLSNNIIYDFYNEDKSYVKYICDSLEFYMLNYQKEYYGLKRGRNKRYKHCKECGTLIEVTNNRIMYCKECAIKINREKTKNNMRNLRKSHV